MSARDLKMASALSRKRRGRSCKDAVSTESRNIQGMGHKYD